MDPIEQVRQAMKELGASIVPHQALVERLRQNGLDAEQSVSAVNAALESGALIQTEKGGVRLPD
ncbi:MAG: hypothetical protein H6961_11290 [Chromatiaceae bacterium]|nr:hypothetical protein [Chromatiaceae bacterium]